MGTMAKFGVIMLVLALLATGVSADTAPAVVSVDSYTVQVGQEFTVPVRIAGVSNLYGADVRLVYDPAILQGVKVDHGYFLQPDFVVRKGFYSGYQCSPICARYALTQVNPTPPKSGSGVLVYVTFKALVAGVSPLALQQVELVDRNGLLMNMATRSGSVNVTGAAQDR